MSLKVLLADDSMTAQNMAKKILADSGYEVTTVSNGAAAVKKIAEVKPDLVILDIYMPGYTGLEVCERVRANLETTNVPVLLTVGKMEPYRPEDGARVRADGIIVKPFEATDLLEIVKKISEKFAPVRKEPAAYENPAASAAEEASEANLEEASVVAPVEVPSEMAVAPAMAFDEVPSPSGEAQWAPSPATVADELKNSAAFSFGSQPAGADAGTITDSMPAYVDEPPTPSFSIEPLPPLPEIEFNAVPQQDVHVEQAADLEPTVRNDEIQLPNVESDPALVTDVNELAKFTTSFGVENAEDVPVGTVTGEEAFLAETSVHDMPEPLAPEQVFTSRVTEDVEPVAEEKSAEFEPEPVAHVAEEPSPKAESIDDFEARVAAAMSAFDQPLADTPTEEPVVEQVDNFIGDPEVANPVSVEPQAVESVEERWSPVEEVAAPIAETPRTLDVNETMVLPAEALLSLEAEMRKAMELRKAEMPEPEPPTHLQVMDDITGSEQPAEKTQKIEAFEETLPEPAVARSDDDEFAAAVNAALSEVSPEAVSGSASAYVEEPHTAPMAMAAAAAAAPAMERFGNFGEEKLASAVQTAVERLKPQIIAEIVKALKGE